MDELEEIKRKKMEQMKKEMNTSAKPFVELPDKPIIVTDATIDAASIASIRSSSWTAGRNGADPVARSGRLSSSSQRR